MKKYVLLIVALMAILAVIAACAPAPEPTKAPAPQPTTAPAATAAPKPAGAIKGTLTLWHAYHTGGSEEKALNQLLDQIKKDNPDLKLTVLAVPFDQLFNKYETEAAAGGGPDLWTAPNDNLGNEVRANLLKPLDDQLKGKLDKYSKLSIDGVTVGGKMYAVPMIVKAVALYYNKDKVKSPPKTTDDLMALVKGGNSIVLNQNNYHNFGFFPAFGGQLMDAKGACTADQGGFAEAMQYLVDLKKAGAKFETDGGKADTMFRQKQVDMIINGPWVLGDYAKDLGASLGVVPMPAGPKGSAKPLSGIDGWYVNVNSKNVDAAVALGLALTTADAQKVYADVAGDPPVRTDVSVADPLVKAFADAGAAGFPRPQSAEFGNWWGPFGDMVTKVLEGKATPKDGVAQACADMNKANKITVTALPAPTTAPTVAPTAAGPQPVTLTINLRKGVKWSDGTDLTSKDVLGTWNVLWMQSSSSWNFLNDVTAPDPQTVVFNIKTPGPAILDTIIRSTTTRPYAQYGKWMDAAAGFRKANADRKGTDVTNAVNEMLAFRPANAVVYGPYNIDPKSVTEAQLTMVKNPTGFNADKIDFDKVVVYWGDTTQDMPLYLSGDMDYSSNAYSPANLTAIRAVGTQYVVLGGPATNGPGMYFNNDVYPLNKVQVRQAFAYYIDRVENCKVAFGESCRPVKYQVGFTDAAVPTWLSDDQIKKLNTYDPDPKKGDALLTGLGFKKGSDGIWVDDKGKPMAYELIVPADFTEYLASSENVAQQLAKNGIKITVKPYQSSERNNVHKAGAYQISMDIGFRFTYFHPFVSYDYNLRPGIGFKNDPEGAQGARGMNLPYKQKTIDGKEIDIKEWVTKLSEGFDANAQKPYVADVASMFNLNLPVLEMFERYLTDPIDTKTRVTGWLPVDDKIYKNNQNNSPVARQFLSGSLKPSATNKAKEFKTSYPYTQPPKANYNLYSTDNVMAQGAVLSNFIYPPFTYYDVNEGKYVPFFAEKWEIK